MKGRTNMKKNCKETVRTPMMLLNDVSKLYFEKVHAEEQSISKSFRFILLQLANKDGISQLEISRLTHLKPPTISITLNSMEEAGYVERKVDARDRRQVNVFLTAKGKKYNSEMYALLRRTESAAMAGLTEEELASFTQTLEKIKANLI